MSDRLRQGRYHSDSEDYNRYEQELLAVEGIAAAYAQDLAEASRRTRSKVRAGMRSERALIEVSAGVATPLLVSYVTWLLARAQNEGVDRLYFLARDGQILHLIAEAVAPSLRVDVELHYLQASRVTLNLAAATDLTDDTLPWLLTGLRRQSMVSLCERLHVNPSELSGALERHGLSPKRWDVALGKEGAARMRAVLREPEQREILRRRAGEVRARTLPYLNSTGFLDPGDVGIVDLGGAGSQLHALGAIREQAALNRPTGYLVYRERSTVGDQDREGRIAGCSALHIWMTDNGDGSGGPLATGVVAMLEAFCAADHGRVVDYVPGASAVDVVTEEHYGAAVRRWGLPTVRAAMASAVSELVREGGPEPLDAHLLTFLSANLETFIRRPTRAEACAWGRFPVGAGRLEDTTVLAPRLTFRDLSSALCIGQSVSSLSRWWPGSLARTPRYLRALLACVAWLRR